MSNVHYVSLSCLILIVTLPWQSVFFFCFFLFYTLTVHNAVYEIISTDVCSKQGCYFVLHVVLHVSDRTDIFLYLDILYLLELHVCEKDMEG